MRFDVVFDEIVQEPARRVVIHMLEDEGLLHEQPPSGGRTNFFANAKRARTARQAGRSRQSSQAWREDLLLDMYRRLSAMSAHSDSSGIAQACRGCRRSGLGQMSVHWPGMCSYAP